MSILTNGQEDKIDVDVDDDSNDDDDDDDGNDNDDNDNKDKQEEEDRVVYKRRCQLTFERNSKIASS